MLYRYEFVSVHKLKIYIPRLLLINYDEFAICFFFTSRLKEDMKNEKQDATLGTVPKSKRKIINESKSITLTHKIHDHLLSWLGTGTSVKSGGVIKLVPVIDQFVFKPLVSMLQSSFKIL